ncbi:MAG: GNAT family N-acetyltransferase [Pseudomonadota bacterium]
MSVTAYEIAHARAVEAPAIRAMQARSLRELGRGFYAAATIESYLRAPGTLDVDLIEEGHYFVARDRAGRILGSAGWSQRQPAYARHGSPLATGADRAIVRAVFVEPDCARQGIGTALMHHVERDSLAAGIELLTLSATLSGVPLYLRLGYRAGQPRTIVLSDGAGLDVLDMSKSRGLRRAA